MFSVIIPVYNKANSLRMSIDSVIAQTCPEWELIVVNDGSTDDFSAAIAPYCSDNRIRVIQQQNQGVSVARNQGIRVAKEPYLAFLDADDEWAPNHLAVLQEMILREPGAGVYATAFEVQLPDGSKKDNTQNFIKKGIYRETDLFGYMGNIHGNMVLNILGTCVSAQLVARYGGFQPGVRIGEDTDFFLKLAAYSDVVLSSEVTGVYHRELSTATREYGTLDFDWYFMKREKTLLEDENIPLEKRHNIRRAMDHFRIHKSRHYLLLGKRKLAMETLHEVQKKTYNFWARQMTWVMVVLPKCLLTYLYKKKKEKERE